MNEKKKHHYVPVSYLNSFCDAEGKLYVSRKENPEKLLHQKPENTAFRKYYYSQPTPEGEIDNNKLEDFFAEYESNWPSLVERIEASENINSQLEQLFSFIALQRARVPAMRDAVEFILRKQIEQTLSKIKFNGELPPPPEGFEDIAERISISVDPHESIHAIPTIIKSMESLFDNIGLGALHNKTKTLFFTSDNPVIWFDPSIPENEMEPYNISLNSPIVLIFPISPRTIIIGHSSMKNNFSKYGFGYGDIVSVEEIDLMNQQICKFAYEAVFSNSRIPKDLTEKYANKSPVLGSKSIDRNIEKLKPFHFTFGSRETKPKWNKSGN